MSKHSKFPYEVFGLLSDGSVNLASVRCGSPIVDRPFIKLPSSRDFAKHGGGLQSRGAARSPELTDEDCKILLTEVIAEMARLQVEAWFESALRSF
jgi:hypothetical protein